MKKTDQIFIGKPSAELLEYRFNTQDERLPELTHLSAREAFMLAGITTINRGREYAAQLAAYNIYIEALHSYESYPARKELYEQYLIDLKKWEEDKSEDKGPKPIPVDKPGERIEKPTAVKKPKQFYLSDDFTLRLMKHKRSVDGKGLTAINDMAKIGLETTIEEGDAQEPIDAP